MVENISQEEEPEKRKRKISLSKYVPFNHISLLVTQCYFSEHHTDF